MKTKLTFLLATIMGFLFVACSNDSESYDLIGNTPYKIIELEADGIELSFNEKKGMYTGTIPSEGANFKIIPVGHNAGAWPTYVEVDGTYFWWDEDEFKKDIEYFSGDWGIIEGKAIEENGKKGEYQISFHIEKNPSSAPREFIISLEAGNLSNDLKLTQDGADIKP
ncbi:MAG: hypothetical protein K2G67_02350 [Muribaculaceae bacterium]|nr:hypothetical protein [Muribaculaceae bacterium]